MMFNDNEVPSAAPPIETPLYVQAQETLDRIRESLLNRVSTVEGEIKGLSDEHSHLMNVLNRITPPAAQTYPVNTAGAGVVGKSGRNW
jgi:hypothetical protein